MASKADKLNDGKVSESDVSINCAPCSLGTLATPPVAPARRGQSIASASYWHVGPLSIVGCLTMLVVSAGHVPDRELAVCPYRCPASPRSELVCTSGPAGESEAQHEELVAFARTFSFERMGAFAYSAEEGTPAVSLPEQVTAGLCP